MIPRTNSDMVSFPFVSFDDAILNALPHPVLLIDPQALIVTANDAAQSFLQTSLSLLRRQTLDDIAPFGSPLLSLVEQARQRHAPVNEYRVDIGSPRLGAGRIVDIYAAPLAVPPDHVVVMLQERGIAEKIDRQLSHRGAARSVTGLAAMLAHEIKNPLSGIRGAAQLLETAVSGDDRSLTTLITEEADRIVRLVERMEVFSDERPIEREQVNVHMVLEHVKRIAQSGFAKGVRFVEDYDPSLPSVMGNRDQLVQVFLNLVKNAAEAVRDVKDPEITLSSAFRQGVRLTLPGSSERVSLPLEFCVRDNGPGVAEDMRGCLFDPFVTTKVSGSGLGLALVAKIIGSHGGVIELDPQASRTTFRVLLPKFRRSALEIKG